MHELTDAPCEAAQYCVGAGHELCELQNDEKQSCYGHVLAT